MIIVFESAPNNQFVRPRDAVGKESGVHPRNGLDSMASKKRAHGGVRHEQLVFG